MFERPAATVFNLPASRAERLADLRGLLAKKFPAQPVRRSGILPTGIDAIDGAEGGLRLGAMTEMTDRRTDSRLSARISSRRNLLATNISELRTA